MEIFCTIFDYDGNEIDEVKAIDVKDNSDTGSISCSFPPSKEGYSFRIRWQESRGNEMKLKEIVCK